MLKYIKKEIENLTEEAEFFKKINDLTNNVPGANSRIETIKLFFKKLVDNDAAKLLNPSDISDDLDTELGGKTDSIEVKKQNRVWFRVKQRKRCFYSKYNCTMGNLKKLYVN